MIETLLRASESDARLFEFLGEVREYAHVYVLAKQRHKGCDGMGELATMKEEFGDMFDKMIQYSRERKYISRDASYDIDEIADEIVSWELI